MTRADDARASALPFASITSSTRGGRDVSDEVSMTDALELDAVIFGGGAAGLWMLDEFIRAGRRCLLLEAGELGAGQTIASQGIIHGGLKYTLSGLFSSSARAIADMPRIWRQCLAGEAKPNLSSTRLRAHSCVLWQTTSLKSRLGMMGARAGLRVAPRRLAAHERPPLLAECPGIVARLDEQVIEPWSFIADLSEQHRDRIIRIDADNGLEFSPLASPAGSSESRFVRLLNPETGAPLDLRPRHIILAAGAGNARLREMSGLRAGAMQQRPLHMVMLRGERLPALCGHCTDGAATRVTITSTRDFFDRAVWQVGGQIAERGVAMDEQQLIRFAHEELRAVLPGIDLKGVEWATYRANRAEAGNAGARPSDVSVIGDGNILTCWPTKLALAPRLAQQVLAMPGAGAGRAKAGDATSDVPSLRGWPQPVAALPPWETTQTWKRLD